MITAMFFTNDLHIDWRLGESFFMQHPIDGEIVSNNGAWPDWLLVSLEESQRHCSDVDMYPYWRDPDRGSRLRNNYMPNLVGTLFYKAKPLAYLQLVLKYTDHKES